MQPNLPLLLESPERLIRRLAAELIARDREEENAKAKADAKARWVAKNRDRVNWHNFNSNRRKREQPILSFEEYLATVNIKEGKRDLFDKGAYYNHNSYRRRKGLPKISYEEYVDQRAAKAKARNIDIGDMADETLTREARYQRLKERLKTQPKANETRASVLGIRTPKQMREATMENESVQRHILDKLVRQEGAAHLGAVGRFGWYSLGEGCHWKGRGRGWR